MTALFFVMALLSLICLLAAAFNVVARVNLLALALFVMIWVITYGRALT